MIQTLIPLGLQAVEEVLQQELAPMPRPAREMALGLGNPARYADLRPGEVVLDLGSGGGIDTLLAAYKVGPAGRAIGLDMTESMLERARAHAAMMGRENVEFLHGMMESIPLPEACVDVAICNGVINLSTRRGQVFAECFRVLRPGGRARLFSQSPVDQRRQPDQGIVYRLQRQPRWDPARLLLTEVQRISRHHPSAP